MGYEEGGMVGGVSSGGPPTRQSYSHDEAMAEYQAGRLPMAGSSVQQTAAPAGGGTSPYPAGVQQILSGRSVAPPFSLFRGAGLQVPSMQAQRNLLPSELAVYAEAARLAGIPLEEYQRELAGTAPGFGRRGPQFQWQRAPRMSYGYSGDWG